MTQLRALRASEFTIRAQCPGSTRKIFKMGYLRSDGSVWVAFPYFEDSHGLVSLISLPPGRSYASADLRPGGKVTSHLVKYSHHRSGLALFSQTGRVRSAIRKQSVRLNVAEGHLFTIQIQALDGFAVDMDGKPDEWNSRHFEGADHQTVTFDCKSKEPVSLKFVVRCYNKKRARQTVFGEAVGPLAALRQVHGGRPQQGVLLAAPRRAPGAATFLVLLAERISKLTDMPGSHLTFIGGFDPPEVVFDYSKPTSFLALAYPAGNYQELCRTIGSIDLHASDVQHPAGLPPGAVAID